MKHIIPWLSYLWQRFEEDQCMRSAAALTYMSLFALVPLMTVSFAMVAAVPAFSGAGDTIQGFIFEHLVPSTGAEIQQYLADFSRQARNITGIGIGFLIVTAVLMLRNIESAFNLIWRTRQNRSPMASFLLYWAVLSLGPLCIGLALGISTYLASVALMFEDLDTIGLGATLLKTAPFVLSAAAFTLIYAAVPNCPVPLRHALLGGLVTAIVFNAARSLFTNLVVGSSYTVIYGAFAAFPLFLLWVYLSWNIVLAGGVIVHSLSSWQSKAASRKPLLLKAVSLLHLFWLRQRDGLAISELDLLTRDDPDTRGLDSESWRTLRDQFLHFKLLQINERGHYMLARDLGEVTLWQLKEWTDREVRLEDLPQPDNAGWQGEAARLLLEQRQQERAGLETSLAELFEA
jgi:membrane protein